MLSPSQAYYGSTSDTSSTTAAPGKGAPISFEHLVFALAHLATDSAYEFMQDLIAGEVLCPVPIVQRKKSAGAPKPKKSAGRCRRPLVA